MFIIVNVDPKLQKYGYLGCFHAVSTGKIYQEFILLWVINTWRPNDVYKRQWTRSLLIPVLTCCLAPQNIIWTNTDQLLICLLETSFNGGQIPNMMTSTNGKFSALLAICAGNSPVPGEFPARRPVTRSFDVFFDLHPNKRLSKQWWGWWFETPSAGNRAHYDVIVMKTSYANRPSAPMVLIL